MTQVRERRVCPHALSQRLFLLCAATYIVGLFGRLSYSAVMVDLIASGSMDKAQAGSRARTEPQALQLPTVTYW